MFDHVMKQIKIRKQAINSDDIEKAVQENTEQVRILYDTLQQAGYIVNEMRRVYIMKIKDE